jgi:carbamoylphosphate synthase large subunit
LPDEIGYPVVMRPSYVLGGRDMRIVYNEQGIRSFMAIPGMSGGEHPVLLDQFLKDAIEVDVDAVSDGRMTVIGGIMEHIEEAGIHSGDSACVLPPHTLSPAIIAEITTATKAMAQELGVIGSDEYSVRGSRADTLYPGGQSPGLADRTFCFQGNRCAAGQNRHQGDAGNEP